MQKTVYIKLTALILLTVFLASCSIQKRVYNRGFHIEWRETNRKVVEGESLKARKASKIQHQNSGAIALQDLNEVKDTCNTPAVHPAITKQKLHLPSFYQTFSKPEKKNTLSKAKTSPGSVLSHYKKADKNYYDYPNGDVSSGLGGFLVSLTALLVFLGFGSVPWGLLLLLIAVVLCVIGIIQQTDEPDTKDLIFAVLGLCICGLTIYLFMPVISPVVLFFIANPGVLLCLLLILGIYLLMSA